MTDPTPEPDEAQVPEGNVQIMKAIFEASATVRKADGSIREEGDNE